MRRRSPNAHGHGSQKKTVGLHAWPDRPCRAAENLAQPAENPAALDAGPDDVTPDGLDDELRRAWGYVSGNY